MKKSIMLFIMLGFFIPAFTQIIIDETDMPNDGDSLRVSMTTEISGDYSQTGPDMIWDFSDLNYMSQQVNSFVNILNTPSFYWVTFIPGIVSNLASPGNNLPEFPGYTVSNYFTFFKKSGSLFSDFGLAFQLSGLPIMLKYDSADIYYIFPCTMGKVWITHSFASISLPGLAYFSSSRTRTSQVDGWGSLTTPYGTFQTIRIKSQVIEHDSLFVDTLGVGFPYNRYKTEYKWLGKGQGIPLLQINEEGVVTTAIYRDIPRLTGINELRKGTVKVFPNPSDGIFTVNLEGVHFPAYIQILDTRGSIITEKDLLFNPGKSVSYNFSDLPPGLYMIRLISKNIIYSGQVVIIR